jgi:hypothetical protein
MSAKPYLFFSFLFFGVHYGVKLCLPSLLSVSSLSTRAGATLASSFCFIVPYHRSFPLSYHSCEDVYTVKTVVAEP